MDFHLIDRVINMLNYITPQDAMIALVEGDVGSRNNDDIGSDVDSHDGLTPERAYIIIRAAQMLMGPQRIGSVKQ